MKVSSTDEGWKYKTNDTFYSGRQYGACEEAVSWKLYKGRIL